MSFIQRFYKGDHTAAAGDRWPCVTWYRREERTLHSRNLVATPSAPRVMLREATGDRSPESQSATT